MLDSKPLPGIRPARDVSGLLTTMLATVLVCLAIYVAIPRVQQLLDDWRYGMPRTMHLAGVVGHEDQPGSPTRFVAMNLNRQPIVVEFPGGSVEKARILKLPYLFGAGEDLTPVVMRLERINGDELLDLVVSIKAEEVVYINEAGSYRLITDAERAAVENGG